MKLMELLVLKVILGLAVTFVLVGAGLLPRVWAMAEKLEQKRPNDSETTLR